MEKVNVAFIALSVNTVIKYVWILNYISWFQISADHRIQPLSGIRIMSREKNIQLWIGHRPCLTIYFFSNEINFRNGKSSLFLFHQLNKWFSVGYGLICQQIQRQVITFYCDDDSIEVQRHSQSIQISKQPFKANFEHFCFNRMAKRK